MKYHNRHSHRFLLAFLFLLSASALLVAASSAANNRPILGDPNEVYDARTVLFHNAKIDTRLAPQFHQEPHLLAKYDSDNNIDQGNSISQYLLHTDERITASQQKAIEDTLGAPLLKYFPHNTWHITTTATTARALQSLGGVHWVGHYHPKYKLHINVIEENHNLKLAKYKPMMARFLEASASNMSSADKKLLAHHFSHLSASSVHPEGTILGQNPFELYAVLPKWTDDMGQVENLAAAFTQRLQKDHSALAERVKISAGSGDLLEGSCKNEADLQALADFFSAQSETFMVTRKSIQRVHNRWARGVSQSNVGNPDYAANTGSVSQTRRLNGEGQVIGISDSGLDWQSCFFHDTAFAAGPTFTTVNAQTVGTPTQTSVNAAHRKVIQYVAWADRLDENGHGTHVAGSVAGKVYAANNAYAPVNGMSQEAKIAFFDIGVGTAGSLTVPNNYDRTLFPWAKVAGAAIHSNSWGSADNSYSIDAAWADNYMWQNKEFLILVAAGNDGNAPSTIGSPATAKNIVTVGASTNSKEGWEGMFCATGYNLNAGLCNVGRQFGTTSYDKQHIAGFSSVGPTRDGRLKPEVVAPGMFILSAKNRQTASTSCTAAAGTLMTFNAGTSMATPVTAGDVGIIRQWFTEGYYPTGLKNAADGFIPSASLMKAMLISGSRMLDRYGGTVDTAGYIFENVAQPNPVPLVAAPGMVQGYGRVEIDNAIYFQGSPHKTIVLGLQAVAGGRRTEPSFTATGQTSPAFKMCIQSISLENPVRIALVWTDYPGQPTAANPLVNNLDLSVAAKGQTYLGNSKANTAGGTADIRNPSEVVSFDERSAFTPKTDITITVTATRISSPAAQGAQPYTLVVTGDVTEGECNAATQPPTETFVWIVGQFSACSAECATAGQALPTQTRTVTCVGSINGPTTDAKCADKPKPATSQACNTQSCGATTYEWVVGSWSACSLTCGGGVQTRAVDCRSIQTGAVVDEKNCGDHTKPATQQSCNTQQCIGSTSSPTTAAEWRVSDCTTCSAQCQCTREVSCYYYGVKVSDYLCAPENGGPQVKPPATTTCTGGQCPSDNPTNAPTETFSWTASDWGACSVGCTKPGATGGIQTRTVKCRSSMGYDTADNRCAATPRPAAASACNLDPCPDTTAQNRARDFNHQWLMGGWGRCDTKTQTQSRWVICATTNGDNADAAKCEGHAGPKPSGLRSCTPLTPYDSMSVSQRDASVAYTWYTERWGDPTTWCGGNGKIYRYAWCMGTDGKVADTRARCNAATKPLEKDKCLQCDRPCVAQPRWIPGEYWMGCSTIDPCCGTEHRHAFCIDANGQKVADTTACGGKGTEQEYFYQAPCLECPNADKSKCGQFPQGLYPDRGDGPALPGSNVPGTPAMPAGGPLAATPTTTIKPGTSAPATKMTYIRMQANGLQLTGTLTTESGLKAFLVERIATYLQVSASTLQVTYFSRTGSDTSARVVIIVGMMQSTLAKSLLADLSNPDGDIRTQLSDVAPSNEVEAKETNSPTDDVAPATDDGSSPMSGNTMTIVIAAGAAIVVILALVGGVYMWQKQRSNAVKTTARMGPETTVPNYNF